MAKYARGMVEGHSYVIAGGQRIEMAHVNAADKALKKGEEV